MVRGYAKLQCWLHYRRMVLKANRAKFWNLSVCHTAITFVF
jgi:hypothetical protein